MYFMPTIISTSISGMIFAFIFATKNGIANSILMDMGVIERTRDRKHQHDFQYR